MKTNQKQKIFISRFAILSLVTTQANALQLADSPLFSSINVPGNLILALSVEWPTATTPAYLSTQAYSSANAYLGYFDPEKCYTYKYNRTTPSSSYFQPTSKANNRTCAGSAANVLWSGNYLNWASMQTLDTFRWVLTGGYRSVDTPSETILTKTYAAANSLNPDKSLPAAAIGGATPFNSNIWESVASRVQNLRTEMYIGSSAWNDVVVDYDGQNHFVRNTDAKYAQNNRTYRLYINVKVCDAGVGIESNCQAYGANYKPEGLLQKYSQKLRYAAFGYYNDDAWDRDGGVLRAKAKFISPTQPVAGSAPITNDLAEWDPDTGVMKVNPDANDANATINFAQKSGRNVNIPNSGVMNYLNKFGYSAKRYKSYDPVSELYYAALRYFKKQGNVPAYTSLNRAGDDATANAWLDGFPAITNWDDPILYSCQKNFILGIGDVYSHRDGNLPGSILTGGNPAMPAEVAADRTVNVVTANNMVGQLEGIANLGSKSSGRDNTYYIAGLAYDAHTKDIRSDLTGKQTVNTYWVDVLEKQTYESRNQYWLAAKYGGFEVAADFNPYAATNNTKTIGIDAWYSNGDPNITLGGANDRRPDNYFLGNSPERMKDGLEKAFKKIASEAEESASTALAGPTPFQAANGNANYSVKYAPNNWTSTLLGQLVSYDRNGAPTITTEWDATKLLDNRLPSNRFIATWNNGGVGFAKANLSTDQVNSLGVDASDKIAYLRGDRSQENGVYRKRAHLLGDIVNSKLVAVGAPNQAFWDTYNPGYSSFQKANASRPTVLYVGANDGMLHAFDGTLPDTPLASCTSPITGSNCGKELFGYIPGLLLDRTPTNSAEEGLASRTNPDFRHRYLVDATPVIGDVDFKKTAGSSATVNDWRTILVGGLGKGGKGYYALDITDPASWSSETAVAGKVLWEFTHQHMGYSYGDAIIAKTPEFGWTVILASGYNNDDGNGYVFLVNPRNGALLKAIQLPAGSTNIAHLTAYSPNHSDLTVDAVYGGDLNGNLWRIDLTGKTTVSGTGSSAVSTTSYGYAVTHLAKLTALDGKPQPITIRPLIEVDPASGKRFVLIGTGQLLSDEDIVNSQTQSFYSIFDGMSQFGKFNEVSSPITRSTLNANTKLSEGIGSAPESESGWFYDLTSASKIAERITIPATATSDGIVAFAANLPNGDACSPAGTSKVFAVNIGSGMTAITKDSGTVDYQSLTSSVTDLSFRSVGGKTRLYAGSGDGSIVPVGTEFSGATAYKRLNWREVPTAD